MKRFLSLCFVLAVCVSLFAGCGGKKLSKRDLQKITCGDLASDTWLSFGGEKIDAEHNRLVVDSSSYYKYEFDEKKGLITVTYVDADGEESVEETVKYEVISDDVIKVDYGEGLSWMPTIEERETNDDNTLLILRFTDVLRFNGEDTFVPMSCLDLSSFQQLEDDGNRHQYAIELAK